LRVFAKGFNFSQDGPGNRLVYHLSGCNMRCIWCSNPEGMRADAGKDITAAELVKECESCRLMFFSGGGVTFTGGEATLQLDELIELRRLLKEKGIHTALETNGSSERLAELYPYLDWLIMDFKHFDGGLMRKYTNLDNAAVKRNFEYNCKTGREQHIRIPLIRGFNAESPQGFADYFSAFCTEKTDFEFLPYHEYGKEKWTEEYLVKDGFIEEGTLERFKEIFSSRGLTVVET